MIIISSSKQGVILMSDTPQSRGGKSRAENLSPEERKDIARRGALARWQKFEVPDGAVIPKAIVSGVLPLGGIPCAVLDDADNTRVLSQAGFLEALGRTRTPNSSRGGDAVANLPVFLRAKNLEPFISNELMRSSSPIIFETEKGGGLGGSLGFGYKAQMLPAVCWVYHEAKMARKLLSSQEHIAEAATRLLKGLTNVAIDALVDEATGYQDIRAKNALIKLLEKYVSQDALPWVKTFDDEFYKELFRLHGYTYDPTSVKRPLIFAKRTEDIYDRLAPGVREKLQEVVRRGSSGRPNEKLFQHLTENDGYRHMLQHLAGVKAIMKLSTDVKDYQKKLDKVFPRFGDTMQLPYDD
ncbi:P63C domain-containing protein [Agrobacterium tumefaciens]